MIIFDKNRLLSELESIYITNNCTNCLGDCYECEEQEEKIKEVKQFILEYFNPTPLKYEDLYKGMWIWDRKHKMYNQIIELRINCSKEQEIEFAFSILDEDKNEFYNDIFEKNRFYLKELEE